VRLPEATRSREIIDYKKPRTITGSCRARAQRHRCIFNMLEETTWTRPWICETSHGLRCADDSGYNNCEWTSNL